MGPIPPVIVKFPTSCAMGNNQCFCYNINNNNNNNYYYYYLQLGFHPVAVNKLNVYNL
jgi:hypothetical protein